MRALARIAVILAIALFVLLPLHELVDIGEQWPYDGHVVLVLLATIGLAGVTGICRRLAHACLVLLRKVLQPPSGTAVVFRPFASCQGRSLLFLILCLLRI